MMPMESLCWRREYGRGGSSFGFGVVVPELRMVLVEAIRFLFSRAGLLVDSSFDSPCGLGCGSS